MRLSSERGLAGLKSDVLEVLALKLHFWLRIPSFTSGAYSLSTQCNNILYHDAALLEACHYGREEHFSYPSPECITWWSQNLNNYQYKLLHQGPSTTGSAQATNLTTALGGFIGHAKFSEIRRHLRFTYWRLDYGKAVGKIRSARHVSAWFKTPIGVEEFK